MEDAPDATLAPVPFWYLRHGETDWNARDLAQGSVDMPLNATGLEQARSAARLLTGRDIRTIVSSPLSRARVTAGIVADALGLEVRIDADLHEVAYGVQEGQKMTEWFGRWIDGSATPEGAEPFAALRRRAVAAINRATALPPSVLVVAHGGFFRALRSAMGLDVHARTRNGVPFWCVPPGSDATAWRLVPAEEGAALTIPEPPT